MKDFPYKDIIEYCHSKAPEEACGIVIIFKGRYKWIPCQNVSTEDKRQSFAIAPSDFAAAEDEGDIIAIVHSHTECGANPSTTDVQSQRIHGIDWLIVGLNGDVENELYWLKSEQYTPPLYGRQYIWHVMDCGSFVRDFYAQEFGIEITDYYRKDKFWELGEQPYLSNYKALGFEEVAKKDMQYGDVLLMQIGSTDIATHAAIYIGDNKIAHHITDRLSCKDIYGQYYRDRTLTVVRHRSKM